MKVQAIQGFNYNSYKNINQKNLKEISNPIDTETKSVSAEQALAQISFKATPTELANRIKKAPIADKLAVGLSLVPLGGVLVLAKNIEMFTNALQDFVRCTMPEALSYVSFLKDERMKQAFLFINDNEDESKICLYNPNEEDIESWRKVESGEMLELEYNDGGITVDGQWVPLQRKAMTFKNLDAYMDYFITERDLTGELFEWAHEHNNKIIEEISEFFEDAEISEADETSKTTVAEGVLEGEQTKEVKATEKTEKKKKKISFADVGGLDDVVKSLKRNLLYPMKYPEVFKDLRERAKPSLRKLL